MTATIKARQQLEVRVSIRGMDSAAPMAKALITVIMDLSAPSTG